MAMIYKLKVWLFIYIPHTHICIYLHDESYIHICIYKEVYYYI